MATLVLEELPPEFQQKLQQSALPNIQSEATLHEAAVAQAPRIMSLRPLAEEAEPQYQWVLAAN